MSTETISKNSQETALSVEGMHCASCIAHVQKAARQIPGVQNVDVNLARGRAVVRFDPSKTDPGNIAQAVTKAGYQSHAEDASVPAGNVEQQRIERQQAHADAWLRRAIVGIALWLPVELIHWI
ncbi:MAG: heavy-metal-associated domain-containing protein, partial [Anaerolineae bacterium]|nr:heavy-metal-associated domain-containing protein [Phycisphaerae bacterium]